MGRLGAGLNVAAMRVRILLENIKFEHTIFALPFAYLGIVLAGPGWPTWPQFLWITAAMGAARTGAMGLNRLIDVEIDARNPRTANRPIPQGLLSRGQVAAFSAAALATLFVAAWQLNDLCLKLAPLAVLWLVMYPYTKRYTWLSHLFLGVADALGPVGAWLAVRPQFSWEVMLLGGAVASWIAGFDLIYACQDVEVDRAQGLYSVPANFGVAAGLNWSAILHVITALALLALGLSMALGPWYYVGWAVAVVLLIYEHRLVSPADLSRLGVAFFNVNGYIAIIVFAFTLLGLYIR